MEQAERPWGASSATTRSSTPQPQLPAAGELSPHAPPPTCVVTVSASCLPGRAEQEGRGLGTPGVFAREGAEFALASTSLRKSRTRGAGLL